MGIWRSLLIAAVLAAWAGRAPAQPQRQQMTPEQQAAAEADLARFISPRLAAFSSDDEFRRYLGAVLAADRARNGWWASANRIQFAQAVGTGDVQSDAVEPICPESDPQCYLAVGDDASIVVTGSAITPSNPSITNNQMRNVEEGDIVKQIGQFLLMLQDGRLFVVDTRGGGGNRLAVTDRIDVYRDRLSDMWYDEMLVFGDRILVTGYSYRARGTELSVLRLDEAGRLSREGVFYLSSNDYYSSTNYATRLIGDNLVIYTPFEVRDMARPRFRWPVVRRWTEGLARDDLQSSGRPLFDAAGIYRPVRALDNPTVHTVSVCPLGPVGAARDLECRTTAFVGHGGAQWYVTETDAFLWTIDRWPSLQASEECAADRRFQTSDYAPALLYRVPVDGATPGLVAARGSPPDQFSLQSGDGRFRALLTRTPQVCEEPRTAEARLAFFDIPLSDFSASVREMGDESYTSLPGVKSRYVANRFTETHLVYGSLGRSRRGLAEASMPPVFVVPVDRPSAVRRLPVDHTVIRAERAGNDIVLTGYRDLDGLVVTLIDLDRRPRVASSVQFDRRFESEGRSHAFNSRIDADGSGILGLPTISGESRSSRASWRSTASDLSFLRIARSGQLSLAGELMRRVDHSADEDDEDGIAGYACEVSCVDWYGNSRPIFTDGRIFALSGAELIEGRLRSTGIQEVQRINIAGFRPETR